VVEATYYAGIYVDDHDTTITGNQVRNIFANDCFYVVGTGGTISNNLAEGGTYGCGFDLEVDSMTISNNTAQFNSYEGFFVWGNDNTINNNTGRQNGDDDAFAGWPGGLWIEGDGNTLSGNLAEMNPGYGFYIDGANTLTGNTANDNYRTGIYLASTNGGTLMVNANVATNNHGEGIANNATTTCYIVNNIALGNRTDICDDAPLAIPPDAFNGNTFATGGPGVPCCLE